MTYSKRVLYCFRSRAVDITDNLCTKQENVGLKSRVYNQEGVTNYNGAGTVYLKGILPWHTSWREVDWWRFGNFHDVHFHTLWMPAWLLKQVSKWNRTEWQWLSTRLNQTDLEETNHALNWYRSWKDLDQSFQTCILLLFHWSFYKAVLY